jgi:hypothetical protein
MPRTYTAPQCDTPETVPRTPLRLRNRRYSAFMKNLHLVSPVLTSLLLGSMALAQAANLPVPEAPQPQNSSSTKLTPAANTLKPGEDQLISQVRRYPRFPGGPTGPRRGMYSPGFPPPPALSPLGVVIGFGAGAALGASNRADGTVRGHVALGLIGGAIGALIGGAIGGAAHPFLHSRRTYRPSWPAEDADEESNLQPPSRRAQSPRSVPPSSGAPAAAVEVSEESGESGTLSPARRISQ